MSSQRQRLEDAIEVRLIQRLGTPNGRYLEAVEPFNGQLDQTDGPEEFLRALRGRSPAVLIGPGSATYERESVAKNRWKRSTSIELLVSSAHDRTRENRHRSDVVADVDPSADPGIYQILEDVFDAIAGDCFGLEGIGRLDPIREDVLLQEDAFTVWRVTYESMMDAIGKKHDADPQLFTSYEINANLIDDDGETQLPDPPNPIVEADGTLP